MIGDRIGCHSKPDRYVAVPGVDIIEKDLASYDRGRKLEQHVVNTVPLVIHNILVIGTVSFTWPRDP